MNSYGTNANAAQQVARALRFNPHRLHTRAGESLQQVASRLNARVVYGCRVHGCPALVAGEVSRYVLGDPVRYEFPDGSAVIRIGLRWGIAKRGKTFEIEG